jgi:hypothetical protein
MGAPTADLFGQLWTKMSVSYSKSLLNISPFTYTPCYSKVISPLLIILRVVRGRAWTTDISVTSRTPLVFATTHSHGVGSTTLADRRSHISLHEVSKSSINTT